MANRCKICANEITETTLRDHIIRNHSEHGRSVETAYPNLYDDLFTDGRILADLKKTHQTEEQKTDPAPGMESGGGSVDRGTQSPVEKSQESNHASAESTKQHQRGTSDERTPESGTRNADQQRGQESTTHGSASSSTNRNQRSGEGNQSPPVHGRSSDSHIQQRGEPIDRGTSKKWLIVGVGGAGNHILDAILMRRDTLREQNHTLGQVWEGGIADYLSLNTNENEVYETYYAQIDKEYTLESLISNCMIGHNQHAYSGAGRDWEFGRDLMEHDFEGERNALIERWDIDRQSLGGAQAIMLIHSVTKGTGCGATPVLAENLREMLESSGPEGHGTGVKPILSSVVIPSEDEIGGSEMVRGVIGIARLSKAVDGILPFDNAQLEVIRSDIAANIDQQLLQTYNPPKYNTINRLLVSFFEGFTMSSTPISYDASATQRISGDVFDVPDSIRPAIQKYPADSDIEYDPAVVMVPVMGRHSGPTDSDDLDTLVRSTLLQGQFIEFEPDTAWGGTFMIYGPEEKMETLSPLLVDNKLKSIIGGEDFLDRESTEPGESVDIYVNQLVVPQVDSVHLWGLIWNPRLPTLEQMYDHAEKLVSNSNSRQAKALDDVWEYVEPVFGHLGRENMG